MKKIISVMLSINITVLLFVFSATFSVGAITQSEFDSKINSLRSQYPNYSTWANQSFDGGTECYGFARLIGYNVFGSYPSSWSRVYSIDNVKKGDILQYGNTSGSGHTVFVTNVSGDTITFVDCNGNGNYSGSSYVRYCGIKWDNTISKYGKMFNRYSFSYLLSSPQLDPDMVPVDVGTDFYAYITNTASGLYLNNDYDNVTAKSLDYSIEQIWKFERQWDNSYVISSASDNTCLDVWSGVAANQTNVRPFNYNGTDAQKWYIVQKGDRYIVKSKLGNFVLDLAGGATTSGTNVQIYEPNYSNAQFFSIYKCASPSKVNITVETYQSSVRVKWNKINNAKRYDVYLIQAPCSWADVKYSKKIDGAYDSCEFNNVAPGYYSAFVVAKPNDNSVQSNWVGFTATNNSLKPVKQIEYKGHIYSIYNEAYTWSEAKKKCEDMGGHLVTVTSKEEQNVVEELIKDQYCSWYFIGANNLGDGVNYKWITGEIFNYTNWGVGVPDNVNEHYLMVTREYGGKWLDTVENGYGATVGFICEVETENIFPVDKKNYNGHTYELYDDNLTWEDANKFAEMKGGHLATINDENEKTFIDKFLQNSSKNFYWLGATASKENSFNWVTGEPFSYSAWAENEPNNMDSVEYYLMQYKSSGKWNDSTNYLDLSGFLIEYDGLACDVDLDGLVSVTDATLLQKYIANISTLTDDQKLLADCNGDGVIDVRDATYIQKTIVKLPV